MINVKKIEVDVSNLGHITNSYVLYDEAKNAVVIDPGYEAQKIINFLNYNDLNVKYIFITHVHADHIGALEEVKNYTNAKIVINEDDVIGFYDEKISCSDMLRVEIQKINESDLIKIRDSEALECGQMNFTFIHTPGHTIGSMCIYEKNIGALFTGDTIFSNCYGRCDLLTSSFEKMKISLEKIFNKFKDDIYIYPGHGQSTTLGNARKRIKLLIAIKN